MKRYKVKVIITRNVIAHSEDEAFDIFSQKVADMNFQDLIENVSAEEIPYDL